jgi:hypothetical protein
MTHPRIPLTRDVRVVAAACAVVQAELLFQSERLATTIPSTDNEREHLARLMAEYRQSARTVGTLRRYQEGRLARLAEKGHADVRDPNDVQDELLIAGRDVRPFIIDPEKDRA